MRVYEFENYKLTSDNGVLCFYIDNQLEMKAQEKEEIEMMKKTFCHVSEIFSDFLSVCNEALIKKTKGK